MLYFAQVKTFIRRGRMFLCKVCRPSAVAVRQITRSLNDNEEGIFYLKPTGSVYFFQQGLKKRRKVDSERRRMFHFAWVDL